MTVEEHISKLKEKVGIISAGNVVAIAAQDTHSMMIDRVFEQGKNSSGSDIGKYSNDKTIYVNPLFAPKKFSPSGKNGDTKFSNGNAHKTKFFESYKDYRSNQGRKTDKVDLTMFGLFKSDFSRAVSKVDELTYTSSVSTERSKKILEGVKDKYGDVFSLSEKEKENFIETIKYESLAILNA